MVIMRNLGGLMSAARKAIQENPDKVRMGLDKVEQAVNKSTGGKFSGQLSKGHDMVGNALGVSAKGTVEPSTVVPTDMPTPKPASKASPTPPVPPADPTSTEDDPSI